MRVVLDTNVLVSALLVSTSKPAQLLTTWRRGSFELLTREQQLDEIRNVTRRPAIRALIRPALAGELVNFLLSMVEGGQADMLVSGDKRGVLALKSHGKCRIVTVRQFVLILKTI